MHKFTLFTVILSIITVSIVIDIVANGYSLSKDYIPPKDQSTSEFVDDTELKDKIVTPEERSGIKIPVDKSEATASDMPTDAAATGNTTDGTVSLFSSAENDAITPELLAKVGIKDGKVKTSSADKPFLQAITFEKNIKTGLKVVNIFDFEEYLGTIYALHFGTIEDSKKFYSDLKTESLALSGADIRETNTFGDASFYLNQEGKTKTAFSVVRIGADIYGFEYPHSSHQIFKDIASQLIQTN